jgi:hypothetical protein
MKTPDALTSYYWHGDTIRSRSVSDIVLSGTVDIPAVSARLSADWQREISLHLGGGTGLEVGDVEALPLARARMRWPEYGLCVQAVSDWMETIGLADLLTASSVALMACRGAKYHHDGEQYGGAVFCNLFLSEDKGLDVHFPQTGLLVPLVRGTIVIFDTGQPHAVIQRNSSGFNVADFPLDQNFNQVFLTWELPIENIQVERALQITFDTAPAAALLLDEEQVWLNGKRAKVCPDSGRWLLTG